MYKINPWLLGFFLVLVWPSALMFGVEEPAPDDSFLQEGASLASSVEATPGIDSAVKMAQEEIRDPFSMAQLAEPEAGKGDLPLGDIAPDIVVALQGIGLGSRDAYAVIGGDVFLNGDEKNGIKLLEVRRREVDVLVNGGRMTIPLFPGPAVQDARDRAEKKNAVEKSSTDQPSETSSSP